MPQTNPEIDFGNIDYNPNQFSFQQSKADGMIAGRMLMKDEIIRLIKATNPEPTKAVQKIINLVEEIKVDIYANDSTR
jgi:hypothetical protein